MTPNIYFCALHMQETNEEINKACCLRISSELILLYFTKLDYLICMSLVFSFHFSSCNINVYYFNANPCGVDRNPIGLLMFVTH